MARKIKNLYLALERVVRVLPPPSFLLLLLLSLSLSLASRFNPLLLSYSLSAHLALSLSLSLPPAHTPIRSLAQNRIYTTGRSCPLSGVYSARLD